MLPYYNTGRSNSLTRTPAALRQLLPIILDITLRNDSNRSLRMERFVPEIMQLGFLQHATM